MAKKYYQKGNEHLNYHGAKDPKILFVADTLSGTNGEKVWNQGIPMNEKHISTISKTMDKVGMKSLTTDLMNQGDEYGIIAPCPPIPNDIEGSPSKRNKYIKEHRERFLQIIGKLKPKLIVGVGKEAASILMGKQVAVTKNHGKFNEIAGVEPPVMFIASPGYLYNAMGFVPVFEAAFRLMQKFSKTWDVQAAIGNDKVDYQYKNDISDVIIKFKKLISEGKKPLISFDTETTGVDWFRDGVFPFLLQMSWAKGQGIASPIHPVYYKKVYQNAPKAKIKKLIAQWKWVLENPNILKCGHNIKFDHHQCQNIGINVKGWAHDSMQLAFVVDENMLDKSQAECVRRYVPEMAGYSDDFDSEVDKAKMIEVPPEQMLLYACGDTDACRRLTSTLVREAKKRPENYNCYTKVQMPALEAFMKVERTGMKIDLEALETLGETLRQEEQDLYIELIKMVPKEVKQDHVDSGLSFGRQAFLRDILFDHPKGFRLTPRVFTPGTKKLPESERIPSLSANDHLPYFTHVTFVERYIEYSKLKKILSTYVGDKEKGSGFWQYLNDGEIHPSFWLHRTSSGRSSSSNPNAQNFPKRGAKAKLFRRIFIARPGYVLMESDLSQAELRISAWQAFEENMINIYRKGGDIHATTAANTNGMSMAQFNNLPEEERNHLRFLAKAINFGYLYGMGWKGFQTYAKTDYGIEFTDRQAEQARFAFFETFPKLQKWHRDTNTYIRNKCEIEALHGALRRLPDAKAEAEWKQAEAIRIGINAPIQRFASDLGLIGMSRMARDFDPEIARPIAFIHDAVVLEVKKEHYKEYASYVKWYMETPPLKKWFGIESPIPIVADVSVGRNLGQMKEMKKVKAKKPEFYTGD